MQLGVFVRANHVRRVYLSCLLWTVLTAGRAQESAQRFVVTLCAVQWRPNVGDFGSCRIMNGAARVAPEPPEVLPARRSFLPLRDAIAGQWHV